MHDFIRWLETASRIRYVSWGQDADSGNGNVTVEIDGKQYVFGVYSPRDFQNWRWLLRTKPGMEWVVWQRIQKGLREGWVEQWSPEPKKPELF